jgi:arylsulfatase A-like enzyme
VQLVTSRLASTKTRTWVWVGCALGVVLLAGGIVIVRATRPAVVSHDPGDGINVLLISLDTTRRDHLSCYGYARPTTPDLDALAADGMLFEKCIAVSNWTLPTHASMLCGLFPTSHGAHLLPIDEPLTREGHPDLLPSGVLSDSCVTLAEVLQAAGYRTGAVVANTLYLQRAYGLDRGFDYYDDRCDCEVCRPPQRPAAQRRIPYRRADEITDLALRWLKSDSQGKNFFLWLNYLDPHDPFFPPAPYDTRFRDEASRRVEQTFGGARNWEVETAWWGGLRDRLLVTGERLPPEARSWLVSQYDGEIAFMDEQIGRLLNWLRSSGLYERTIIVVTGDHGENFGEHHLLDHNFQLYEPEVAVPLLVKLPFSRSAGARVQEGVQHTDLMPTVLEALSLPVPAVVQGRSLLRESETADLMVEAYINPEHARIAPRFNRIQWALYRGHYKYLEYSDGQRELYNLSVDPGELSDLAKKRPAVVEELAGALSQRRREIRPLGPPQVATRLRPDTEQKLRDLGYLNGGP